MKKMMLFALLGVATCFHVENSVQAYSFMTYIHKPFTNLASSLSTVKKSSIFKKYSRRAVLFFAGIAVGYSLHTIQSYVYPVFLKTEVNQNITDDFLRNITRLTWIKHDTWGREIPSNAYVDKAITFFQSLTSKQVALIDQTQLQEYIDCKKNLFELAQIRDAAQKIIQNPAMPKKVHEAFSGIVRYIDTKFDTPSRKLPT